MCQDLPNFSGTRRLHLLHGFLSHLDNLLYKGCQPAPERVWLFEASRQWLSD
jgi:hypothetical protein